MTVVEDEPYLQRFEFSRSIFILTGLKEVNALT